MTDFATSPFFPNTSISAYAPSARPIRYAGMLGQSPEMQQVFTDITNIAKSQAPVLITGETGTGKDLCARAIHNYSARIEHKFIALNCAALLKNLIESELFGHKKGAFTGAEQSQVGLVQKAHHGTLFLDEVSELPRDTQAKLLRFLQDGSYRPVGSSKEYISDARILCATNRDLSNDLRTGLFREDLYYRLNVLDISMPPLRHRQQDILILAKHFLKLYSTEVKKAFNGLTKAAALLDINPSTIHRKKASWKNKA